MKTTGYDFQSCLAPYIKDFLKEKRSLGFIYESEEWKLKQFDAFCVQSNITVPELTRDLVMTWAQWRSDESKTTCASRFSVIRQFGIYLETRGIPAYLPTNYIHRTKSKVHVLSDAEITALFKVIDDRTPAINIPFFFRLALEYKVILRLIYCCGLRISEARCLKKTDINFTNHTLRILQSKGRKDRLVYISSDMSELLKQYFKIIADRFECNSEWAFPSRNPSKPLSNVTIDKVFREAWAQTPFAKTCDKQPTVHCLRHAFVVNRMNLWMKQGVTLKDVLPYLSQYLGHTSPIETYYYYHLVDVAFKEIRKRDTVSSFVIPEVNYYEEN